MYNIHYVLYLSNNDLPNCSQSGILPATVTYQQHNNNVLATVYYLICILPYCCLLLLLLFMDILVESQCDAEPVYSDSQYLQVCSGKKCNCSSTAIYSVSYFSVLCIFHSSIFMFKIIQVLLFHVLIFSWFHHYHEEFECK